MYPEENEGLFYLVEKVGWGFIMGKAWELFKPIWQMWDSSVNWFTSCNSQIPFDNKKRESGLSRLIFETKKTEQAVTFPAEYCWTFKFQDFAVTERLKYKLEVERLVWVVSDAAKFPIQCWLYVKWIRKIWGRVKEDTHKQKGASPS